MTETGYCRTEKDCCYRYCYGIEWGMERGGSSQGIDLGTGIADRCGPAPTEAAWPGWGAQQYRSRPGQAVMSLNSMSIDFKAGRFRNCEAFELAT
jgi:hypothetical protein